jgi:hypothetical protein
MRRHSTIAPGIPGIPRAVRNIVLTDERSTWQHKVQNANLGPTLARSKSFTIFGWIRCTEIPGQLNNLQINTTLIARHGDKYRHNIVHNGCVQMMTRSPTAIARGNDRWIAKPQTLSTAPTRSLPRDATKRQPGQHNTHTHTSDEGS